MLTLEIRLVLAVFACHRLSQLVALDAGPLSIFESLRKAAGRRAAAGSFVWRNVAELLSCPYCLGMWFAILCLAPVARPTGAGDLFLLWWGIAGGQAFLEGVRRADE